eukprot:Gb_18013 [translate_table: standard]
MGALKYTILAVAGFALAWLAVEIAFKPHLDKGRDTINKSLDRVQANCEDYSDKEDASYSSPKNT